MADFSKLLESNTSNPEIPDSLFPIGMLDQILTIENVIKQVQDREAECIHENYLDSFSLNKKKYGTCVKPAIREWKDLPEIYRKSNRIASDHIDIKLRAFRYKRTNKLSQQISWEKILDENEILETLAKMEHSRWMTDRSSLGWKQGKRIDHAKIHDNLVPWDELPRPNGINEDVKEYDRKSVRNIPEILSFAKQGIQKEVYIGVTGHRLNKIKQNDKNLMKEIENALHKIEKDYPYGAFIIMSSLAEGSDRIVAELAMEILNAKLIVPLPLPYELYIDSFVVKDDEADEIDYEKFNKSIEEFTRLIGKAERYFELPLKFGSVETLGNADYEGHKELRSKQYALAGAFIVERCDELIVVWDGNPRSDIGGTAQIKEWREAKKVSDEFACPSQFFLQPEMKDPIIIEV